MQLYSINATIDSAEQHADIWSQSEKKLICKNFSAIVLRHL